MSLSEKAKKINTDVLYASAATIFLKELQEWRDFGVTHCSWEEYWANSEAKQEYDMVFEAARFVEDFKEIIL